MREGAQGKAGEPPGRREPLGTNIQYVKGVGPKGAALFSRLGIHTVRDLLFYRPRGWQDRTRLIPIKDAAAGQAGMFLGQVLEAGLRRSGYGRSVFEVFLSDGTGGITLVWFNQPYVAGRLEGAERLVVWGKVKEYKGAKQIVSPEYEIIDGEEGEAEIEGVDHGGIVPVYGLTEGLTNRRIRRVVSACLAKYLEAVEDWLEEEYLGERELPGLQDAIRNMHFPESEEERARALRRLKYDELFILETAMALRRENIRRTGGAPRIKVSARVDERIRKLFDFEFTGDQEAVIKELRGDLERSAPMNRLLQGDVGSGKTVIAIYAMLSAVAAGQQAAMMAPTSILAEQHFRTIRRLLRKARVRFELLTGGASAGEKRAVKRAAASGELDIVIGTHSLVQEGVDFKRLGLVVMDEQHKFGVMQRAVLRRKGTNPHCLVMTATPIPRTLTLTVFGDLDVSVLEKPPPGRGSVVTRWVGREKRPEAFRFIRGKLAEGRQAFFVYPLIEATDALEVKSAVETARELEGVYGEYGVALVTGAMSSKEKEAAMRAFRSGKARVLVATVVIEVGIDIPNASIMVIENAERFGLSQLHQLRGRIGRGRHRSYCLLFGEGGTEEAEMRLRVMATTTDGFKIAEEDLKIRGPGEFFGTRQHGLPEFVFADIVEDWKLLQSARKDAFALVERDPLLSEHRGLYGKVLLKYRGRLDLIEVG